MPYYSRRLIEFKKFNLKDCPFKINRWDYSKIIVQDKVSSGFLVQVDYSSDNWDAVFVFSGQGECFSEMSTGFPCFSGIHYGIGSFSGGLVFYPDNNLWGFLWWRFFVPSYEFPFKSPWIIYKNGSFYLSPYFKRSSTIFSKPHKIIEDIETSQQLIRELLSRSNLKYPWDTFCPFIDLSGYHDYKIVKSVNGDTCIVSGFQNGQAVVNVNGHRYEVPAHTFFQTPKISLDGKNWGIYGCMSPRGMDPGYCSKYWVLLNGVYYEDIDNIEHFPVISARDFGGYTEREQVSTIVFPPYFTPDGIPFVIGAEIGETYVYLPQKKIPVSEIIEHINKGEHYEYLYFTGKLTRTINEIRILDIDPSKISAISSNKDFVFVLTKDLRVLIYKIVR